jgi:hypothetical protein
MKKKEFLTEAKRKAIISEKEKAIIESFTKTFNKIKRIDENEINEMEKFDATAYQEKNNFNPTSHGDKYNVQYELFYCDGNTCGNHMWKTVDVYANSEEEAVKLGGKELKHWEEFAFNGAANEFDEFGEPMFKIERYEVYGIENESAIQRGDI